MPLPAGLWVILPAFNEEEVIAAVIESLQDCGIRQVLVVDDGSTDNTSSVARKAGARVIRHLINRGAGAATQTGLAYARTQEWPFVALMDADGQHNPRDVEVMWDAMETHQYDMVIGSRFQNRENRIPFSRRFFNRIGNIITNLLCQQRYTDSQSGLRLLNESAIQQIEFHIDGFGYCSEMIFQAEKSGLMIGEVPTCVSYSAYSMRKGQDFEVGITTAVNFIWKVLFR
jgi:glycosyltransferase involved in cell wall biosynthesis